ncbi:hypothetical protein BASA62_002622 [Batrachochytrium salamandrivorans]|nr:hypothetical protein BASA62_002622 [Batrachochytrium salamandrivorans]
MSLGSGYLSSGGFCNKPRDPSPDNKLIGFDGKSYNPKKEDEVDAFAKSWKVRDEDVLTNSGARTLNLPARFGTVCRIPEKPQPNPVIPVPTMTTTTTTTTTTSSSTVDLSKSTLSPTITYTLSSTTITTSPSTTSTTSPYLPDPPTPGGDSDEFVYGYAFLVHTLKLPHHRSIALMYIIVTRITYYGVRLFQSMPE